VSEPGAKRVRRRRTDPDEARAAVLDAAEELLRAEGPGALRLGEIATRAGLSHSNVLYHFNGMKDLEARLGRRLAIRLADEIAEVHRSTLAAEIPTASAAANTALFAVLSKPENARLIYWMLITSEPSDLAPLAQSILAACAIAVQHPSFAGLPREAVMREIVESGQMSVATALGLGMIRPWVGMIFGTEPAEETFVERLGSVDIDRIKRFAGLLTARQ